MLPASIGAVFRTFTLFSFTAVTGPIRMTLNSAALSNQGMMGLAIGLPMTIISTELEV
jgi:hypothetical protein